MSRAAKDTFRSENKAIYFLLKINNPNIIVKVISETTHFIIKMNFEESLPPCAHFLYSLTLPLDRTRPLLLSNQQKFSKEIYN